MKFDFIKGNGHTHKFYLSPFFFLFDEAFKYGDGAKFLGYVGKTLNHCVQNYVVLLSVISS
jgi:hypothetical protein